MALLVRKSRLLTRIPRTPAARCLLLVVVVCIIKIALILLIMLVAKYRKNATAPPFYSDADINPLVSDDYISGDASFTKLADFAWRPNLSKVAMILEYLNMTEEEAMRSIPLTVNNPFLSNNEPMCGSGHGDPVDLLYLVQTSPVNFRRRLQMRNTIMNEEYFRPFKVRVAFLLGQAGNISLQSALNFEHALYKDTVQGDFLDSPGNRSLKGVLGFRWAARYCSRARYVIKMDDNMFFDTYKILLRYRGLFEDQKRTIFCNVWVRNSLPVYREDHSWTVDARLFQGMDRFPFDHCSGLATVVTGDLVPSLYRAAFFTPTFFVDDIYLFGMLPWVAGDVTMMDLGYRSRYVASNTTYALSCMKVLQHECSLLAAECFTTDDWETMWNLTHRLHVEKGWKVPYLIVN